MLNAVFPFSAIVGQEKVKMALLLNAINPSLGGVLITGPKGSGKSTIVRAFGEILPQIERVEGCRFNCNLKDPINLCPSCKGRLAGEEKLPVEKAQMRIVELPLSATEDGLLGTLDVEEALREGIKALRPGLLAEANQNILYIDEVNLLPDYLVNCILDPAASGWNVVQREGLSLVHPAHFTLVASMNPEEGELRPQILDRFALSTRMEEVTSPRERAEIIRRNLAFEEDPIAFCKAYEEEQESLRERITEARNILPKVKVPNKILNAISTTTAELRVDGFRPDLAIVKAARALAALEGRNTVEPEDVLRVSGLALSHRTRGGQEQAERLSIEECLRDMLFKEVPFRKPEEEMAELLTPTEVRLPDLVPPGPSTLRRRRGQREISHFLSQLILAGLMVVFLFVVSVSVLVFKAFIFGLPSGGIREAITFDQVLLTMGFSGIALAALFLLFPTRTRRPAIFFYESLGRGFQRRLVQVQRAGENPEGMDAEEQKGREAKTSRFEKIINIPLYASIGRLRKLILDRGPKFPSKDQREKKRYSFSLERRRERRMKGAVGRHAKTEARSERGRYVSYEFPKRKPWDLALGPTLRAAAIHRVLRQSGKLRLKVDVEDIRVKVREMRAPLTIILLLDMSESMAIALPNIRNAVLSMHDIAYKKHDRVGLVVFKGPGATTLQPPTTNLNLIVARLKDVGASDLTPLAAGMFQSWRLLRNEKVKNKDIIPVLVIISDGIANVPLGSPLSPFTRSRFLNNAQADVVDAAFLLQREGIQTLVINPSHVPVGASQQALYKADVLQKTGKTWLEPTELLMQIPIVTGGYYYGIGEGGTLESINLTKAFGVFR